MDTRQLLTFTILAQTCSYKLASEQLQYAPSSLFKHIQMLEQEVGFPLFAKSGRMLHITPEGEAFLPIARRILQEYHSALQITAEQGDPEGTVTLGGCEMNTDNSLLNMLTCYTQQHPKVRLNITTSPNAAVPARMRSEIAEVAFYYSSEDECPAGMQKITMYSEPVQLLASPEHPLASKSVIHWDDLNGVSLAHPHDNCCIITTILERMQQNGASPANVRYLGSMQLVVENILHRGAMAFIPWHAARHMTELYGMKALPLEEEELYFWEMILFRNYDLLKPNAKQLVNHSAEWAKKALATDKESILRAPSSSNAE